MSASDRFTILTAIVGIIAGAGCVLLNSGLDVVNNSRAGASISRRAIASIIVGVFLIVVPLGKLILTLYDLDWPSQSVIVTILLYLLGLLVLTITQRFLIGRARQSMRSRASTTIARYRRRCVYRLGKANRTVEEWQREVEKLRAEKAGLQGDLVNARKATEGIDRLQSVIAKTERRALAAEEKADALEKEIRAAKQVDADWSGGPFRYITAQPAMCFVNLAHGLVAVRVRVRNTFNKPRTVWLSTGLAFYRRDSERPLTRNPVSIPVFPARIPPNDAVEHASSWQSTLSAEDISALRYVLEQDGALRACLVNPTVTALINTDTDPDTTTSGMGGGPLVPVDVEVVQ